MKIKNYISGFVAIMALMSVFTGCNDVEEESGLSSGNGKYAKISMSMPEVSEAVSVFSAPTTAELTITEIAVVVKDNNNRFVGCDFQTGASNLATHIDGAGTSLQTYLLFDMKPSEGDTCYVICNSGIGSLANLKAKIGNPSVGSVMSHDMHYFFKLDATTSLNYNGSDVIPFSGKGVWATDKSVNIHMQFAFAKLTLSGSITGTTTWMLYNDNRYGCYFPYSTPCAETQSPMSNVVKTASYMPLGSTIAVMETINPSVISGAWNVNSPFILIRNDNGGNVQYYRIDMWSRTTNTFLNILRHTDYKIVLDEVIDAGYSTAAEAIANAGSNLVYSIYSNEDEKQSITTNHQYAVATTYEAVLIYGDADNTTEYNIGSVQFKDQWNVGAGVVTNSITASSNITVNASSVPLDGSMQNLTVKLDNNVTSGSIVIKVGNITKVILIKRDDKLASGAVSFKCPGTTYAKKINENENIYGFSTVATPTAAQITNVFYSATPADCYLQISNNITGSDRMSEVEFWGSQLITGRVIKVIIVQDNGVSTPLQLIVSPWNMETGTFNVGDDPLVYKVTKKSYVRGYFENAVQSVAQFRQNLAETWTVTMVGTGSVIHTINSYGTTDIDLSSYYDDDFPVTKIIYTNDADAAIKDTTIVDFKHRLPVSGTYAPITFSCPNVQEVQVLHSSPNVKWTKTANGITVEVDENVLPYNNISDAGILPLFYGFDFSGYSIYGNNFNYGYSVTQVMRLIDDKDEETMVVLQQARPHYAGWLGGSFTSNGYEERLIIDDVVDQEYSSSPYLGGNAYTWSDAKALCDKKPADAQGRKWRLPTKEQLFACMDYLVNLCVYGASKNLWTSSEQGTKAWCVNTEEMSAVEKTTKHPFVCVREL